MTHFVAKALGKLLNEYPLLNSIIMGGKIFERETCDVFVAASLKNEGAENLSGVLIRDINQKNIEEVSDHIYSSAKQIRRGNDVSLKVVKNIIHCVPRLWWGDFYASLDFCNTVSMYGRQFLKSARCFWKHHFNKRWNLWD